MSLAQGAPQERLMQIHIVFRWGREVAAVASCSGLRDVGEGGTEDL